jgi:uncharacterized protein
MANDSHAHPHHKDLVNADGSWKYTNQLAGETSPYLLQHAHNPVDWHPWGEEAFELSRKLGKPIFLSVGYSTCYWCHVMERQVFENPEIAGLMNEHFVNVKVDREERPDIDDIYMVAVQVMTGRGGWPMSVFLTPPGTQGGEDRGLKPFYAGTYFPPEPAHGMPSFPQVLLGLSKAWNGQRAEIIEQAAGVAESVEKHLAHMDDAGELNVHLVQTAANALLRGFDPVNGGFGDAPKFPTPTNLLFLLKVYQNNQDEDLWKAIGTTLEKMARGGMYDQVGGGFHRYSVDEKWLVPHFEKMLYDNGLLAETYAIAQATHPNETEPTFYGDIARETCEYVLREMVDGTGAFWSAQDAEVDAMEGKSYLWLPIQIAKALAGNTLADQSLPGQALMLYGVDKGTNFQDPHHAGLPPENVLFLPAPLAEFAKEQGITLEAAKGLKRTIDARLLKARNKRKQPGTDDKVLAAWNGMMIAGMAKTGKVLGEAKFIEAAGRAADAILKHMTTPTGRLYRAMRNGQARIPGFLDDYAYFIHGLIVLHEASGDEKWLKEAMRLTAVVGEDFACPQGGYYDTLAEQKDLFVRTRSTYDGAIPTGNSQMIHNLLDLARLTRDRVFFEAAAENLRSFAVTMKRTGQGMTHMHHALLVALELAPPSGIDTVAAVSPDAAKEEKRQVLEVGLSVRKLDLSSGQAEITIGLDVGPDYHLNGPAAEGDGLAPTRIELVGAAGVALEVKYPEAKTRKFEFADKPIMVYEGSILIHATLTGKVAAGETPKLILMCQVCTEMSCLAAREYELPVEVV